MSRNPEPNSTGCSLADWIGHRVVLDTACSLIYIGELRAVEDAGFWLADADVHDRSEGHSTKEEYISEARRLAAGGARRANRRKVFVERRAVVSLSALDDVVSEEAAE